MSYICTAERNDYLARVWVLDGRSIVDAAPVRVGPGLAENRGIARRRLPRRAILIEDASLFTGPATIDGKEMIRVDGSMTVVGCQHGTYIASLAAMRSDAKARAGTIRLAGADGRVLLTRQ